MVDIVVGPVQLVKARHAAHRHDKRVSEPVVRSIGAGRTIRGLNPIHTDVVVVWVGWIPRTVRIEGQSHTGEMPSGAPVVRKCRHHSLLLIARAIVEETLK